MANTTTAKTEPVRLIKGIAPPKTWDKDSLSFVQTPRIQQTKTGRVVQIKFNSDLRMGTDGLIDEIRKMHLDSEKLSPGNYIVFVNSAMTIAKLLTKDIFGNPTYQYVKMPKGRFIDARVIQYLPQAFNGEAIDYDKALEKGLSAFFGRIKRKNPSDTWTVQNTSAS